MMAAGKLPLKLLFMILSSMSVLAMARGARSPLIWLWGQLQELHTRAWSSAGLCSIFVGSKNLVIVGASSTLPASGAWTSLLAAGSAPGGLLR